MYPAFVMDLNYHNKLEEWVDNDGGLLQFKIINNAVDHHLYGFFLLRISDDATPFYRDEIPMGSKMVMFVLPNEELIATKDQLEVSRYCDRD